MTTGDHAKLADLIARLIRHDHRRAQPLPLLCLVHDAETPSPVDNLARRLHAPAGQRRVRYARPNLTTLTADPEHGDTPADGRLPALLRALRRELSSNTSGPDPLVEGSRFRGQRPSSPLPTKAGTLHIELTTVGLPPDSHGAIVCPRSSADVR